MRLILERKIPFVLNFIYIFIIKLIAKCIGVYHPVILDGKIIIKGERKCIDRWDKMKSIISNKKIKTILDLGCAEGFFLHTASKEFKCIGIGVDADIRRLNIACNSALINETQACGFIYMEISQSNIEQLPDFDCVIFLSVLHHVMYEKGFDEALLLLKCIKKKTRKVLFFDMGQSNEITQPWSSKLPNMGENPSIWIKDLLIKAGFTTIEELGVTDSYRTSTQRNFYAAYV